MGLVQKSEILCGSYMQHENCIALRYKFRWKERCVLWISYTPRAGEQDWSGCEELLGEHRRYRVTVVLLLLITPII